MAGSQMHIIDDAYHDCHLSTLTLCLTVTWKLKFFGELSLGGAMFGDQRPLSLRDYVETYSFAVPTLYTLFVVVFSCVVLLLLVFVSVFLSHPCYVPLWFALIM
jgi:hypothetical protein